MKKRRRTYRLGRRAERQAETRGRIVEAAVELHSTIGPLATTVSAVAKRAGVQRLTVYRHFPDRATLFAACSHHFMTLHPPPDPRRWAAIADPVERAAAAIAALYDFYAATEGTMANLLRDAEASPARLGMTPEKSPRAQMQVALVESLAADFGARGDPTRAIRAAVGHALAFRTWQSLVREQRLSSAEAVALMRGLIQLAAQGPG